MVLSVAAWQQVISGDKNVWDRSQNDKTPRTGGSSAYSPKWGYTNLSIT